MTIAISKRLQPSRQHAPHSYSLPRLQTGRRAALPRYTAKRDRMVLRYRRQRVRARARFQQELDRALHPRLQKQLGITVCLDDRYLARPGFIAQFDWGGHHWVLTCQAKPWGCEWYFRRLGGVAITQCNRQTLELELRYALQQLRQACQQVPADPQRLQPAI